MELRAYHTTLTGPPTETNYTKQCLTMLSTWSSKTATTLATQRTPWDYTALISTKVTILHQFKLISSAKFTSTWNQKQSRTLQLKFQLKLVPRLTTMQPNLPAPSKHCKTHKLSSKRLSKKPAKQVLTWLVPRLKHNMLPTN